MEDEDTGAEPNAISASFADPYVLLIRDDASIFVVACDDSYDLEEVEREDDVLLSTKWLTGCLYTDTTGTFANVQSNKGQKDGENIMMFLLSAGGALYVSGIHPLVFLVLTSIFRSTHCLTCRKRSMSQKGSALCRRFSQLITLREDLLREKL
jgi:hypothetical protein